MPGGPGNLNFLGIPHIDKVGHFGMYAVWTFLFFRAFSTKRDYSKQKALWISILTGAGAGIILEFLQYSMRQGRSFELADMLANALGAGVGGLVALLFFKKYR
jgi:VanZ family protein